MEDAERSRRHPSGVQLRSRSRSHARRPRGSSRVDLDDKTAKAKEREGREESPLPDKEKAMWACVACGTTICTVRCRGVVRGGRCCSNSIYEGAIGFAQSATTTIRGGAPCAIGPPVTLVTGSAHGRDVET